MASLNVSLSDDLRAYVDERVRRGGFSTPSEFVRQLIREDQRQEADRRLEALLLEGLDSGAARKITEKDWKQVRAAVKNTLAARRTRGRKRRAR